MTPEQVEAMRGRVLRNLPPGPVTDLVLTELDKPVPDGSYFRGLASMEKNETTRHALLEIAKACHL